MNTAEHKRPVTVGDAIKELEREATVRRRVYPDWVRSAKLTEAQKNDRMIRLEYAIKLLKKMAKPEQTSLF